MTQIIFHQYGPSPFSQKIRKILAWKDLAYHQIEQPAWMPKPHLTPLTGGYRRIPVMQMGADIYCDSALIARLLERIAPEPSIYAPGLEAATEAAAEWADRDFFLRTVPLVFTSLADVIPDALFEDRQRMSPRLSLETLKNSVDPARSVIAAYLERLEHSLSVSPYLMAETFSLADAAVYHCLWFARNDAWVAQAITEHEAVAAWMLSIDEMGVGHPTDMSPDDGLRIARESSPEPYKGVAENDPCGLSTGMEVKLWADDLPSDVFRGILVGADDDELVIERTGEDLGRTAVHFPRSGFSFQSV